MSMTEITRMKHRPDLVMDDIVLLTRERVSRAKAAYTTRRADLTMATRLLTGEHVPSAGDLLLALVVQLRQHKRLELASGRRAHLRIGDEIIVVYGSRYAPDQFEALLPTDLGPCDLVAAGGLASNCRSRHASVKRPTLIEPVGLLADDHGAPLNLSRWSLPEVPRTGHLPTIIAVVGTMMNAGKTTCAGDLIHGYKGLGMRVGAAKVTGTGAGCDRWVLTDAGADRVLDFTDMGIASTFGLPSDRVEAIFQNLIYTLAAENMDVIVVEIADGIYQKETADLLQSNRFIEHCDGLIFAAGDGCGALTGVRHLQAMGHKLLAVGGAMTASPLATHEAQQVIDIPVVTNAQMSTGQWLPPLTNHRQHSERSTVSAPAIAGDSASRFAKWIMPTSRLSTGI